MTAPRHLRRGGCQCLALLLLLLQTACCSAGVLFEDDFSGASLSAANWDVANWTLGRTQLAFTPDVSGGSALIRLDTYNPDDPGNSFKGTEIYTDNAFSRGTGIEIETRMRMLPMSDGLVASSFSFEYHDLNGTNVSDEIDVEILSKQFNDPAQSNRVLLTSYNDWDAANPDYGDTGRFSTLNTAISGLNVFDFNTYTIRWLEDRTEWLINGALVHSTTAGLADDPMKVRLNLWAPGSSFSLAYDAGLQPAASSAGNQTFLDEVDYVTVSDTASAPEPSSLILVLVFGGALVLSPRPGTRPRFFSFSRDQLYSAV